MIFQKCFDKRTVGIVYIEFKMHRFDGTIMKFNRIFDAVSTGRKEFVRLIQIGDTYGLPPRNALSFPRRITRPVGYGKTDIERAFVWGNPQRQHIIDNRERGWRHDQAPGIKIARIGIFEFIIVKMKVRSSAFQNDRRRILSRPQIGGQIHKRAHGPQIVQPSAGTYALIINKPVIRYIPAERRHPRFSTKICSRYGKIHLSPAVGIDCNDAGLINVCNQGNVVAEPLQRIVYIAEISIRCILNRESLLFHRAKVDHHHIGVKIAGAHFNIPVIDKRDLGAVVRPAEFVHNGMFKLSHYRG